MAQRLLGGRYRVEQVLGSGGMGTVWRGYDLRLDRPVAVKVLSNQGLSLPKAMERFDREARAVARLSHPNIVPIYDFGAEDGDPYIVMELVDGPTVADLLTEGPLPIGDVLAISTQICDGLTAAHAAEIVHRDIKPSNLILTATGVVKICDFGVARILDTTEHVNLTGTVIAVGSPKYMAPEHINGEPVDRRADLYGLGCSMYAMLTGHPPFSTGTSQSIAHQHLANAPEPLRVRRPDAPADVEALVADLLAKTPDERPPDAIVARARIAAAADLLAHGASDVLPSSAVSSAAVLAARRTLRPADDPEPREPNVGAAPISVAPAGVRPSRHDRGLLVPRPGLWLSVAAVLVTATVAVAAFIAALPSTDRAGSHLEAQRLTTAGSPAAAGPSPSAARSAPATARAQTQPSPTESASPSPTDPIVAMHRTIQQQVDAGDLKADAARDLTHMVDDLAKTLTTANPDDETKKIRTLRDKLAGLYRDGKLTDFAYTALNGHLDAIAAE
ncbi:serine/threonine-protein kinase [Dactylosporangium darangshiense]|uniref:Protein kinase domain-containing protein n=1 Tax=Dactylosporangium darangshiense TaxID=579108 RepID=A0ABP8CVE5_9ACTN